jgi:hypothetical protein
VDAAPRAAGANPQGHEVANERNQTMIDEFPTRGHLLAERGDLIAKINDQATAIMAMGGNVSPPSSAAFPWIEYEDITDVWPSREELLTERQEIDAILRSQQSVIMSMRAFSEGMT